MSHSISFSDDQVFHLSNANISYLFRVSPEGLLEHVYFGVAIPDYHIPQKRVFRSCTTDFHGVSDYSLSDVSLEYPFFGASDNRVPAILLRNPDGGSTNIFKYKQHRVLEDKPSLDALPSARGDGSATLEVDLVDDVSNLRLTLAYTIYRDHDVIARSARLTNEGAEPISIEKLASSCINLPAEDFDCLHLTGTWARELNVQRQACSKGMFTIGSLLGASSNKHSPFMALVAGDANETTGEVFATTFVYSGNFEISVECGEFGSLRQLVGINPTNFCWSLHPGQTFSSPEALHVFSSQGLHGMSQTWHGFIREKISPEQFKNQARPTYLNSWEAAYFDINENKVMQLAQRTKDLGLDMLVVDDGWFQSRNDDTSSLGDWVSDKGKFPNGIESVAKQVREMGLKFGLWFEPEMVNPDSDLYRNYPEWVFTISGQKQSLGRNQLILDLGRPEVRQYLFERINEILSCGDIDYVKWDMNRVMSEIGSGALSASQQGEAAHRYMLGVYDLVGKLTKAHPQILFENCASGGNRFDLGMLSFMSQSWTSDMSEPIGRLAIIEGASYLFPLSVLASYICPVPSHQNARMVSLKTRAEVGFFAAARGLSLNAEDVEQDYDELKQIASWYKETAADVLNGKFSRLLSTSNEVVWQLISEDGDRIYLGYFHILSAPNLPFRRVRLRDLAAHEEYHVIGQELKLSGAALMNMGMSMPYVCAMQPSDVEYMPKGDFSSTLIVLHKQK